MANQELVRQEQSLLIGKTLCLVVYFVLMSMMMIIIMTTLKSIHHHSRIHDYGIATLRCCHFTFCSSNFFRCLEELKLFTEL